MTESDVLFVDSSHVSKYASDVNYLLFNVLPKLKPGVLIHFHDVFKDFEYPREWLKEGIYWNEQYLLRAFLLNNKDYEIVYFSDFMEREYTEWFQENMPLCLEPHEKYQCGSLKNQFIQDIRGQSIWIRKIN